MIRLLVFHNLYIVIEASIPLPFVVSQLMLYYMIKTGKLQYSAMDKSYQAPLIAPVFIPT